jgi:tetratricopeptide (TPR) repeat protein
MRMAIAVFLFIGAAAFAQTDDELREKALKLNKEATNEDAANKRLKELNADKVTTPKLVKVAAKTLKDAKKDEKPFRFYAAMVLAKAAQNCKEYDAAEAFYAFCYDNAVNDLASSKLTVLAGLSQIDFYLARKQYPKAIKACEKFLELNDDGAQQQAIFVLEKKLRAKIRNGEADAALDECNELLKGRRAGNILLMNMKASLLREAGKLKDALDLYTRMLEKIEKDEEYNDEVKKLFGTSVRYAMSGVFTELDRIDEAAAQLEKLIEMNPENPTFKNDLGFIWADHDKNMEKAEKLIREAVEQDLKLNKKAAEEGKLDPDLAKKANPAYIDSLGWVLYKNKKYDEALKYLLESANAGGEESDHIEIWDHVGDCYLALNRKKEALEAFQKGLKGEDVTKKDAERRRKVTEKINKLKKELK